MYLPPPRITAMFVVGVQTSRVAGPSSVISLPSTSTMVLDHSAASVGASVSGATVSGGIIDNTLPAASAASLQPVGYRPSSLIPLAHRQKTARSGNAFSQSRCYAGTLTAANRACQKQILFHSAPAILSEAIVKASTTPIYVSGFPVSSPPPHPDRKQIVRISLF